MACSSRDSKIISATITTTPRSSSGATSEAMEKPGDAFQIEHAGPADGRADLCACEHEPVCRAALALRQRVAGERVDGHILAGCEDVVG